MKLSAEIGRAFIQHIYTSEMQEDVLKDHARAFLSLGEMYNLE